MTAATMVPVVRRFSRDVGQKAATDPIRLQLYQPVADAKYVPGSHHQTQITDNYLIHLA